MTRQRTPPVVGDDSLAPAVQPFTFPAATRWIGIAVLAAVWLALPLILPRSLLAAMVFAALYALAGLGVSMLLGFVGIISIAQHVFYGLGAYATAVLTVSYGLPAPVGFLAGVGLSLALAYLVGRPVLRLSGLYLALATLALGIVGNAAFVEFRGLTGGTLGIGGILTLSLGPWELPRPAGYYYLTWVVVALAIVATRRLLISPTGFALRGLRDSPAAAKVLGIDVARLRTHAFAYSAVLGSVAGALFAHYVGFISTHSFTVTQGISFLLVAILGGMRSVYGPILGAIFVAVVPEIVRSAGDLHQLLFGLALVLMILFAPNGIWYLLQRGMASLQTKGHHHE